ncbi:MAG: cytochrome c3 family protein, partial [Terriglobia bacterium]
LNQGPVRTCLSCHEELAAARVNKAHPHRPVFEDSCVICHQPHASERARLLRAEVNDLCLQCHGSQLAGALEAGGAVKLFDGAVEVDPSSLAGVKILPLRPGAQWGHPYPSHPVASGEEITCITCHNPHATARSPKLLVTDTPTATPLCVSCHG